MREPIRSVVFAGDAGAESQELGHLVPQPKIVLRDRDYIYLPEFKRMLKSAGVDLKMVASLGYAVSVHRIPSSLLGTVGAFTEMHAVKLAAPNDQHIAEVDGHDEEAAYRAACMLAELVGIELEDG